MNNTHYVQPKMSLNHAAEFLGLSVQAIHYQLKTKNLTCPKIGNRTYITHSIAKQLFQLSFKKKIIAAQIVKGGTGKTTTVQNIACCANTYGATILVIDIDPQGNLTDAFNIDPENIPAIIDLVSGEAQIKESIVHIAEGIDLIPSRIENVMLDSKLVYEKQPLHTLFSDLLTPIASNYDFIFIDCPPTMGHSVTAASLFADILLAPLNPDKFSAKGIKILKKELAHLNKVFKKEISYKVFLNKFSGNTLLSDKTLAAIIADPDLEGKVLQTAVRFAQEIPNVTDINRDLFSNLKKSPIKADFDQLTRELLEIGINQ